VESPPRSEKPEPTAYDHEIAKIRQDIAAKQGADWVECFKWALGWIGPGFVPSHRHMLIEKAEEERARREGGRARAAATVYTVKHEKTGDRRHFTVVDGKVIQHESYEAGFGAMLLEPDLTRTIEVRGQNVHPHRFSLRFAPYELYRPKSPEQLAALRVSRERGKVERAAKKFAEDYPLLAFAGLDGSEPS